MLSLLCQQMAIDLTDVCKKRWERERDRHRNGGTPNSSKCVWTNQFPKRYDNDDDHFTTDFVR